MHNNLVRSLFSRGALLNTLLMIVASLLLILCIHLTMLIITKITPDTANNKIELNQFSLGSLPDGLFAAESLTGPSSARAVAVTAMPALTLKGLMASSDPSRALAIIAGPQSEESYRIGETIAGAESWLIKEISANQVILQEGGRLATLYLETEGSATGDGQLAASGQPLAAYLALNPIYSKGKLLGYHVNPKGNSLVYRKIGLLKDDVIIKINDQSLQDEVGAKAAVSALGALREAKFTVLREQTPQHISINLDSIESSSDK